MRKILIVTLIALLSISPALAVIIDDCYSGRYDHFECEYDDMCYCEISGNCTDGDLIIYRDDVDETICIPEIFDSEVEFNRYDCEFEPNEIVYIRAICEEDYSPEEELEIYDDDYEPSTTTVDYGTTTISGCPYTCQSTCLDDNNPPTCFDAISHGGYGCGNDICCEVIPKSCPYGTTVPPPGTTTGLRDCPYECCIDMQGYEYKYCQSGMRCCDDNKCRDNCTSKSFLPTSGIIIIILIVLIPIGAFVFYLLNTKSKSAEEF